MRAFASILLVLVGPPLLASVEIVNVGADASAGFEIQGGYVAMRSSEARAAATDLNGDGDLSDSVLQVYDVERGVLSNTRVEASGGFRMAGRYIAFSVLESRQGGADLNGDGDASDLVQHVYDAATRTVTNLALASGSFRVEGNLLAFTVVESAQGNTDRNGDGDARDGVLALYDLATGVLTNVGLDASGGFAISGGRVVFAVSEANQGGVDLNGDGDAADNVVHLVDGATGEVRNLGLATLSQQFELEGSLLALLVRESSQGNADRNGDGDANDGVLHLYRVDTGTIENLGRAASSFQISGRIVAFAQSEASQGGADANGDLDAFDDVLHTYDASTSTLRNLEAAVEGFQVDGVHLAFAVRELRQGGTDLNGDGDTSDLVLHLHDLQAGTTVNLAIDTTLGFKLDGDMLLAFGASEDAQGVDLNQDGDLSDFVLHVFDIETGNVLNLAVDPSGGFQAFQVQRKFLSFGVQEPAQGASDLNGDGDSADIVLHYFEAGAPSIVNLGFDVTAGHQLRDGRIAFAVTESRQGLTDLNADGDTGDVVLHLADVRQGSASDLLLSLIDHVRSLSLPRGIERGQLVLLELALRSLDRDRPCHAPVFLQAFQFVVSAHSGKHVPSSEAQELNAEAEVVLELLRADGCGRVMPSHLLCHRGPKKPDVHPLLRN